jgi:hypothetical protein
MTPEVALVAIVTNEDLVELTVARASARASLLYVIGRPPRDAQGETRSEGNTRDRSARLRPLALAGDDRPPCVTYEVSESPIATLAGSAVEWNRVAIKIDCFATTYGEAMDLRRNVKALLHNLAVTAKGVEFRPIRHVDGSDQDLSERAAPGQVVRIYRLTADFTGLFRTT